MVSEIKTMDSAPKDGSRVLIKYHIISCRSYGNWGRSGVKWEECRWVDNEVNTGSKPHWEPWCGNDKSHTTEHIKQDDCIGWCELPEVWE